jgi:hypothetical protein
MSRPGIFLNTAGDIHLLPKMLDAASRFQPTAQEAIEAEVAQLEMEPLFT